LTKGEKDMEEEEEEEESKSKADCSTYSASDNTITAHNWNKFLFTSPKLCIFQY
jgi:hypothetical protein